MAENAKNLGEGMGDDGMISQIAEEEEESGEEDNSKDQESSSVLDSMSSQGEASVHLDLKEDS